MIRAIKRLWLTLPPSRRSQLVFHLVLRSLVQIPEIASYFLLGVLVGKLAGAQVSGQGILSGVFETLSGLSFLHLSQLALATFCLKVILSLFHMRQLTRVLASLDLEMALKVKAGVEKSGVEVLRNLSQGEISWSIGVSSHIAYHGVIFSTITIATEVFVALTIVLALLLVNPVSTLGLIITFSGFFLIVGRIVGMKMRDLGRQISESQVEIMDITRDLVLNFRVAKFSPSRALTERFRHSRALFAEAKSRQLFLSIIPRQAAELFFVAALTAITIWTYSDGSNQLRQFDIGILAVGGLRILGAALPIQTNLANLRSLLPQTDFALQTAQSEPDREQGASGNEWQHTPAKQVRSIHLEVSNLTFGFEDGGEPILKNLSFDLKPGGFLGIVGESGSGKSTLLDLILGLRTAQSGNILINGIEASSAPLWLTRHIGYVAQQFEFMKGSVLENICLSNSSEDIDLERVRHVIRVCGLEDTISQLPGGLNYQIGKNSEKLSGGQKQRLAIARALYQRPLLLVLDEPSTGLDSVAEDGISRLLGKLKQECTIVAVSHSSKTISEADSVISLTS